MERDPHVDPDVSPPASSSSRIEKVRIDFQKPQVIATFSFDESRRFHNDDRSKKYFRWPPLPEQGGGGFEEHGGAHWGRKSHSFSHGRTRSRGADLNYGYERLVSRNEEVNEHLDALLASLIFRAQAGAEPLSKSSTGTPRLYDPASDLDRRRSNVITWRGIMTRIFTALNQDPKVRDSKGISNRPEGFSLNAMALGSTLYLEDHVDQRKAREERERKGKDERLSRFGYYGYSFESFCTVGSPEEAKVSPFDSKSREWGYEGRGRYPPGWSGDVNTNVQWCQVVKTRLNETRMILGGEVDCEEEEEEEEEEESVELKTSVVLNPNNPRSIPLFELKLLRIYFQSFLLGIPSILVGFRDAQGHLVTAQEFNTLEIPRLVRGKELPVGWDALDSMRFADRILNWIRKVIVNETRTCLLADRGGVVGGTLTPPPSQQASQTYPVFRVDFSGPEFDCLTIRRLSLTEVDEIQHGDPDVTQEINTNKQPRVGFLTARYYEWNRDVLGQ
ncbi:RAI1-domain-containing protein [Violaceomyces palustris]|uniref:RAI1-domain-containing protein n=1 Tax=Violaceomyces palustris TaxID=1673888 RepID=A0ACD0NYN9_9BASI|nr:RAI1-domain-containing protein [Violaceomyces palustris]